MLSTNHDYLVFFFAFNALNINLDFSFPGSSDGKESAGNTGDPGSIPGSGRSPGERNGQPLQYVFQNSASQIYYAYKAPKDVAKMQIFFHQDQDRNE